MKFSAAAALLVISAGCLVAQQGDLKQRIRAVRDLGKSGSESITKLAPYVSDPEPEVRIEAVKALGNIGTARSLDPLIAATTDNDPEVQIRATDGLVNFYSPGYIQRGLSASLKRAGNAVRAKFSDNNDLVIPAYVQVRPEVVAAIGKLARGGMSMDSRANAARAIGILRGRAALEDLYSALRSKNDQVMYESIVAIQKIRDESAGSRLIFLLRDLNDRVQGAAIETVGLLRTKESVPVLHDLVKNARNEKARRASLSALAMIADPSSKPLFTQYLADKDDALRAAAAEGYARLKDRADLPVVSKYFDGEAKMNPRLSFAFASVALGRNDFGEFSPLRYLVNTLNSAAYRGVAQPFLLELSRDPGVRRTLYNALNGATRDEKIYLGQVFAQVGDKETLRYLEAMATDSDPAVAEEGVRSLKTLKARI